MPSDPSDEGAQKALTRVFIRLCTRGCPELGPPLRSYALSKLVTHWMQGYPLSRLIDERIRYLAEKGKDVDEPAVIRSVMEDVEQIARFEAPRGLSAYCEVLQQSPLSG